MMRDVTDDDAPDRPRRARRWWIGGGVVVALLAGATVAVAASDDWAFWGQRVTLHGSVQEHLNGATVVVAPGSTDERAWVTVTRGDSTVTDELAAGQSLRLAWWGSLTVREVSPVGDPGDDGSRVEVVATPGP